jgi:hypothetical protein
LRLAAPKDSDVAYPIGKRAELVREPNNDVPNAAFTADAALYPIELRGGHRAGAKSDHDAIGQARRAAKRLALERPIPSVELQVATADHTEDL